MSLTLNDIPYGPTESDIVFDFSVENFLAYPTFENYQNVVFKMCWKLIATYTDSESRVYSCEYINMSDIKTDNITDFVPFENLTKEIVKKWIDELPDINDMKNNMVRYNSDTNIKKAVPDKGRSNCKIIFLLNLQ